MNDSADMGMHEQRADASVWFRSITGSVVLAWIAVAAALGDKPRLTRALGFFLLGSTLWLASVHSSRRMGRWWIMVSVPLAIVYSYSIACGWLVSLKLGARIEITLPPATWMLAMVAPLCFGLAPASRTNGLARKVARPMLFPMILLVLTTLIVGLVLRTSYPVEVLRQFTGIVGRLVEFGLLLLVISLGTRSDGYAYLSTSQFGGFCLAAGLLSAFRASF